MLKPGDLVVVTDYRTRPYLEHTENIGMILWIELDDPVELHFVKVLTQGKILKVGRLFLKKL